MNTETTKRWIKAGKILAQDSNAQVLCPVCHVETLKIIDVKNEKKPLELERHMICGACGARNSIRIVRPPT